MKRVIAIVCVFCMLLCLSPAAYAAGKWGGKGGFDLNQLTHQTTTEAPSVEQQSSKIEQAKRVLQKVAAEKKIDPKLIDAISELIGAIYVDISKFQMTLNELEGGSSLEGLSPNSKNLLARYRLTDANGKPLTGGQGGLSGLSGLGIGKKTNPLTDEEQAAKIQTAVKGIMTQMLATITQITVAMEENPELLKALVSAALATYGAQGQGKNMTTASLFSAEGGISAQAAPVVTSLFVGVVMGMAFMWLIQRKKAKEAVK